MRRLRALARLAVGRRVARARLDANGQPHFLDRLEQVALHVDRQRLQRRDVERVQPVMVRMLHQIRDRGEKPRQRLPRPGRGDEQRILPGPASLDHVALVPPQPPAARIEPLADLWGQIGHAKVECLPRRESSSPARLTHRITTIIQRA